MHDEGAACRYEAVVIAYIIVNIQRTHLHESLDDDTFRSSNSSCPDRSKNNLLPNYNSSLCSCPGRVKKQPQPKLICAPSLLLQNEKKTDNIPVGRTRVDYGGGRVTARCRRPHSSSRRLQLLDNNHRWLPPPLRRQRQHHHTVHTGQRHRFNRGRRGKRPLLG